MQFDGKRFLVTGGSGFVGSHVVDQLIAANVAEVVVFDKVIRRENLEESLQSGRVRMLEADVTDVDSVYQAMQNIDGVFHLAVLPLGQCVDSPRRCLDVNVVGTFNVIEAAQQLGVHKIVFSSASSVYGDTLETMDETHPLNARTMYGAGKIAGEYFLRAFHDMYSLDYVILRYMNVYGPRQDGGLIVNVLRRIRAGQSPVIMGDGMQSFDFIYVADVAAVNLKAMASAITDDVFNIGNDTEATVKEIVELLLRLTDSDLMPEFRRNAKVLMTRRVGSNQKAVEMLNWHPTYDLESGLRELIAWERDR